MLRASNLGISDLLKLQTATARTSFVATAQPRVATAPAATFNPLVLTAQPAAQPLPQLPAAQTAPLVFLPSEETPWFKKPAVLAAIGAGVLVLGVGGYIATRR